jgi:hypothetical protein
MCTKKNNTVAYRRAILIAMLAYLIMVIVGMSTTTTTSRIFIEPIRLFSAMVLMVALGQLFFNAKNLKYQRNILLTCLAFGLYGVFLQLVYQGHLANVENSFYNLMVISIGAVVFGFSSMNGSFERLGKYLVIFIFLITILSLLVGGLVLEIPPRFNLEYLSDGNREEIYSLGLSQFFGIGAVVSAFLAARVQSGLQISANLGAWTLYILLSLLGGGRGDSILAVLISLLIIFRRFPFGCLLGLGGILVTAWYINIDLDVLDKLVLYQRLVAGGGDLGDRDVLLLQAFNLLEEQPLCILTGCGFSFFQYFYNNDLGMYPHNFIIEMVITLGLPATILILAGAMLGVKKEFQFFGGMTIVMMIFFYCLLVGLKSQSLLTNWLLTAGILHYFSTGILNKIPIIFPNVATLGCRSIQR